MKKVLLIAIISVLFSCTKTEEPKPDHNIQFSSNVIDSQYYDLTINGIDSNISGIYNINGRLDIKIKLYAAGGIQSSFNGTESLWIRATIYVDGKAVKYFAGYRDTVLVYQLN